MLGNVTLRQLRAFLAVIQEQSFTRAAARLHVTQPAVTAAVKALEVEIGLRLIDRSTRLVLPTEHGERFAAIAARMIEEMEDAVDDLRAHAARERGLVAVATSASFIDHVLAPALAVLSLRYPGIAVRLIQDQTGSATRRVIAGEVDFAVTTLPQLDPTLEAVPLVRDRFGIVCPADHRFARDDGPLAWSALRDEPMIGLSAQNGIRLVIDYNQPQNAGTQRARHQLSSVSALPSLIEAGLGIAVLPALAARPMTRDGVLAFRPLQPDVWRNVYLAQRPGRRPTPAAAELVNAILEQLRGLRGPDVLPLDDASTLRPLGFEMSSRKRRPARRLEAGRDTQGRPDEPGSVMSGPSIPGSLGGRDDAGISKVRWRRRGLT